MRYTLFWSLVALNVLDVLTTKLLLDRGGVEGNPLLGDDLLTTGLVKTAVLLAIWTLIRRTDTIWAARGLYVTVIIYAVVVGINLGGIACFETLTTT